MAKKYLLLFAIYSCVSLVNAQDTTSSYIEPIVNPIKKIHLQEYTDPIPELDEYIDGYNLYTIDFDSLYEFVNSNLYFSEFTIPLGGTDYLFSIQKNDIRSPIYTSSENGITRYQRNITDSIVDIVETYKGFANYNKESYVRVTVSRDNFWGYVYEPGIDDFIFFQSVGKFLNTPNFNNLFVVYRGKTIKSPSHSGCELGIVSGEWILPDKPKGLTDKCTPRYLQIATEADFEYRQKHGQSTFNNILSVLNQAEGVFSAYFNLMFEVVFQNEWTTSNDPYNSLIAFNRINSEFRVYWNNNFSSVQRDLSICFTGISILQNSQGVNTVTGIALATNITSPGVVCNFPTLSYALVCDRPGNTVTTAHEIGHTINMPHPFDIPGNTECDSEPGIMCYGDRGYFFNQSSINKTIDYLNNSGQCLNNFQSADNISPWIKSYSNYRNNRWIGTWFFQKGDQKLVGDFDGDGDEELLFMSNSTWCNMLDYSCNIGSDWYHMWSNMGNRTIGTWYMNPGDRHFTGDFDGNGITDLLSISASQQWATIGKYNHSNLSWSHMWSNMGNGWIGGWHVNSTDKFLISDFDGDGKDELLCFAVSGWAALIDYENGQFVMKWDNGGNGSIGGVNANALNIYVPGKFSITNQSELLTWVNSWVTLLRWNNSTSTWSWIWSQYGANNFANMYILPLNGTQRILAGNFDTDNIDEVLNINNTWVATADYLNNDFNQNWNNAATLGYLEDWDLNSYNNEYLTVKSIPFHQKHILGLKISTDGKNLLNASTYRGNEIQNKSLPLFDENDEAKEDAPIITLYPNPNNGYFNVLIKNSQEQYVIKIVDLYGREVYKSYANSTITEINLSNLASGVYVLTLSSSNETVQAFKFIKE